MAVARWTGWRAANDHRVGLRPGSSLQPLKPRSWRSAKAGLFADSPFRRSAHARILGTPRSAASGSARASPPRACWASACPTLGRRTRFSTAQRSVDVGSRAIALGPRAMAASSAGDVAIARPVQTVSQSPTQAACGTLPSPGCHAGPGSSVSRPGSGPPGGSGRSHPRTAPLSGETGTGGWAPGPPAVS